jgi:asparagine synthase (glutamine-hydrolysing)
MDAFHLSFPDSPDYDESPFAKIAAQYNEAKLHTVEVSDNDLADNFSDTIWHTETPFFNMHSVAKLILCKFVKASGFKSVLTGEGADEIFGGYPHFKRDMALYDSLNQDPDAVKQLTIQINRHCRDGDSSTLRSDIAWINHQLTHGTSWLETQAALMSPLDNLYSLEFSHDYASRDGYRQFYNRLNKMMLEGRSPIHHSMYMLAKSCLPNIVLTTLGDRIEMAASIEGRPPLLDHVVVDLVCSLPSELKIKGLAEKYILREAVKDYIPNEIYTRKKHYFRAPPTSRKMQGKLYEMTFDLLTGNTMKKLPFFDANKTIAFMNRLSHASEAERSRMDYVLTEMAGLCLMQDRFAMVTK